MRSGRRLPQCAEVVRRNMPARARRKDVHQPNANGIRNTLRILSNPNSATRTMKGIMRSPHFPKDVMEYTVPALVKNLELTHGPGNPNFYMSHSVEAHQVPSLDRKRFVYGTCEK